MTSALVSVSWLADELKKSGSDVRVVDVSWYMPAWKRDNKAEYKEAHIPGAVFYDQIECSDKTHPLKLGHMLPSREQFSDYVGKLGINNDHHVVVYDGDNRFGMFSAPRAWWVFKVHGHARVSILDGGMEQWKAEGHPVTQDVPEVTPCTYVSSLSKEASVKDYETVLANLKSRDFTLVDARPEGRFKGTSPEPNPKIKPGHIPQALNLPFPTLMNSSTKMMKDKTGLCEAFSAAGVDLEKPTVAMCGAGLSAGFVLLAAHEVNGRIMPLFDGSWTEWFQSAPDDLKEGVPTD